MKQTIPLSEISLKYVCQNILFHLVVKIDKYFLQPIIETLQFPVCTYMATKVKIF